MVGKVGGRKEGGTEGGRKETKRESKRGWYCGRKRGREKSISNNFCLSFLWVSKIAHSEKDRRTENNIKVKLITVMAYNR